MIRAAALGRDANGKEGAFLLVALVTILVFVVALRSLLALTSAAPTGTPRLLNGVDEPEVDCLLRGHEPVAVDVAPDLLGVLAEWRETISAVRGRVVGTTARRHSGAISSGAASLGPVALYDALRDLPLEIEDVEIEIARARDLARVHPQDDGRQLITASSRAPSGGVGEDVTYDAAEHGRPLPAARRSRASGRSRRSRHGSTRRISFPRRAAQHCVRRLPALGVRVRGARPGAPPGRHVARRAVGREPRPRRASSRRRATVPPDGWLDLYPQLRFKLDPTPEWTDDFASWLAAGDNVDVVDLKGAYKGTVVDNPPNAELYAASPRRSPTPWIEDPALTPETDARARAAPRPGHLGRADPLVGRRRGAAVPAPLPELQAVAVRRARAAASSSTTAATSRDRALRRRPVRARRRPRADPAARRALPPRRVERRRARRATTTRAAARACPRARSITRLEPGFRRDGARRLAGYSYCSASSTFSPTARRAGKIAANRPTMIAAITKTIERPPGIAKATKPIAWLDQRARTDSRAGCRARRRSAP